MRRLLIGVALAAALAWVGWQAAAKERLAATGRPVLFELGMADPRSLIQGDYMILRYRLLQGVVELQGLEQPARGELVVSVDQAGVAQRARLPSPGESLGPDEVLVDYHWDGWLPTVGPDSFFFQEGEAEAFQAARYAELRVAPDGEALLVALRGEGGEVIGRPAVP